VLYPLQFLAGKNVQFPETIGVVRPLFAGDKYQGNGQDEKDFHGHKKIAKQDKTIFRVGSFPRR